MKFSEHTIPTGYKLYRRRWLMLLLFIIYSFNGAQQWAQFTIINKLVTTYYNVTTTQVEWTANIFTLFYIILVVPYLYVIDRIGVRHAMIIGALGITVGNWIKVFSVAPDRFHIAFIGQCCSVSFITLSYGLLGRFTATWFGTREISTAGVLAVLGDLLGSGFAYIFPTVMVTNDDANDKEATGRGLKNLHLSVSITSTVIFFLILFFFQNKPKVPPSIAQIKQKQVKQKKVLPTFIKLLKKPPFILFMVSYGLCCASPVGLATCLNELIASNFPGREHHAGRIGASMMISGTASSLLVGWFLDRTRLFKECAIILTIWTTISMIFFTWALQSDNILFVYVAIMLLGFSVLGYSSGGMQLGIELTFPIHEEISTAMSFLGTAIFAFAIQVGYGYSIKIFGDVKSNIGMVVLNVIAVLATFCIKMDLKRQKAENDPNFKSTEMKEFI